MSPSEANEKLKSLLQSVKEDRVAESKASNRQQDGIKLSMPRPLKRSPKTDGLDPEVVRAAERVAEAAPRGSEEAVESDLLRQLRAVARETDRAREEGAGTTDMKNLIGDMKVSAVCGSLLIFCFTTVR